MKKLILIALICIGIQQTYAQHFCLGIKGGLNYGSMSSKLSGLKEKDNIAGFHAGAFTRFSFLGIFMQPELQYSQRKGDFDFANNTYSVNLHYIDIPVLAGINFLGLVRTYVGPNFQMLMSAGQSGLSDPNFKQSNFEPVAVGFQVGVGTDLKKFSLDLRYDASVTNLGKEISIAGKNYDYSTRASMWQLSIGYKFINTK
jgi:hypothetical protein